MTTLEKVVDMVRGHLLTPPETIDAETNLYDVGLDSLDRIELVIEAEEAFGIDVRDAEIEGLETVGNVVRLVESRLVARHAGE